MQENRTEDAGGVVEAASSASTTSHSLIDDATEYISLNFSDANALAMRVWMSLRRTSNIVFYDLQASLREHRSVTPPTLILLLILDMFSPLEYRELTRISGMNRAAISPHIENLSKRKLIRRKPSPRDRRTEIIEMTEAGRAAFAEAFTVYNERAEYWADNLTVEERSELSRLLEKLVSNVPPDEDTRSGEIEL
ncbi:MarR family winged helix-turn-helix transcriptional regulator [Microbacterium deminutum]|uniref:MarR family winged helix-turn-helix transcriptional regulator n=1 Tax=Microbacterium deminutum TaxID=344164 RepID=UPI0031DF33C4